MPHLKSYKTHDFSWELIFLADKMRPTVFLILLYDNGLKHYRSKKTKPRSYFFRDYELKFFKSKGEITKMPPFKPIEGAFYPIFF
jgi:hypothetical protein